MNDYNTFIFLFFLGFVILIEHWFTTLNLYNYSKKKYPKVGKAIKASIFSFNDMYYIKEIIKNSHKHDKKYSFYIKISRINFIALIIILLISFLLMI